TSLNLSVTRSMLVVVHSVLVFFGVAWISPLRTRARWVKEGQNPWRRSCLAISRLESRAVACQRGAYTESDSEIGIDEMAEHFLRTPLTRYGPSEQQLAAHVTKGRSNRLDGCQIFLNDIA